MVTEKSYRNEGLTLLQCQFKPKTNELHFVVAVNTGKVVISEKSLFLSNTAARLLNVDK